MMNLLKSIVDFWRETWHTSRTLFAAEAIGSLTGMMASASMALYAPEPNLWVVFTLYQISAALLAWAAYKRHSSWIFLLMVFYFIITGIGIYNLMGG